MKIYAETKNNLIINSDSQKALDGFEYRDYGVDYFRKEFIMTRKMDFFAKENIFVGCLDSMKYLFKKINKLPEPIDIPKTIISDGLIHRNINFIKLSELNELFQKNKTLLFVKPKQTKAFDNFIIKKEEDIPNINDCDIIVSDYIDILSEFRVFIYNKKIVYSCNYKGNFRLTPDFNYIEKLIECYKDQPIAYTIDVGILHNSDTTLIEINDFWSIGSYGLNSIIYSKMIEDRYIEIVNN